MKLKRYLLQNIFTNNVLKDIIQFFDLYRLNKNLYDLLMDFFLSQEDQDNIPIACLEIHSPVVYKYGETISWEYGSQYRTIIHNYENYCPLQENKDIINKIFGFINKIKIQFYLFFLMDELLMDGQMQPAATGLEDYFIPGKKINYKGFSRSTGELENWKNVCIEVIRIRLNEVVNIKHHFTNTIVTTFRPEIFKKIWLLICSLKYPI